MKAITYLKYGNPEVLEYSEIAKPKLKPNEVLIKVQAASVNSRDWDMLIGHPYVYRLLFGLFKPRYRIIGTDISGIIEETGDEVSDWKPGDVVYGANPDGGYGAFAEFISLPSNKIVRKPNEMTMEEAAAIPEAGLLAYQALYLKRKILPGDKVLINGAGGGAGTYAVQMAKGMGALVTAVDSEIKVSAIRRLGADEVLNYQQIDFAQKEGKYDLILDFVATRTFFQIRKKLNPNGVYIVVGGSVTKILSLMFWAALLPKSQRKKYSLLAYELNANHLKTINELYTAKIMKPIIDKVFALQDASSAMDYFNRGSFVGKIVLKVQS
ncbi:NAD(P)-dependent alcohol dehydrogenase [Carboxylicivirga linearis]|uniref:NAD(P)-dependent alcohol dehydrogenase n=1 Tax=Carboxylicivirga linearis TaxID=1628157 RepID=A0ABS5JYG1_9BACT|nr:NAD(P)-dependent alcohol dehydrogenase [Carboxylicivirga linearis]MBS2099957.1 NAD(P)-dependent alcohol dehydrogenase [Carboxylicivirga linearis]